MLFSKDPAEALDGKTVVVSKRLDDECRSARAPIRMCGVREADVCWAGNAEMTDIAHFDDQYDVRLVIGDAALVLGAAPQYPYAYDLGEMWKQWTDLPFVFAVWVARRFTNIYRCPQRHAQLIRVA